MDGEKGEERRSREGEVGSFMSRRLDRGGYRTAYYGVKLITAKLTTSSNSQVPILHPIN